MVTDTATIPEQTMQSLTAGVLCEQQAREIVAIGPEAAVFVILELSKQLAEQKAKEAEKKARLQAEIEKKAAEAKKLAGQKANERARLQVEATLVDQILHIERLIELILTKWLIQL